MKVTSGRSQRCLVELASSLTLKKDFDEHRHYTVDPSFDWLIDWIFHLENAVEKKQTKK